MFFLIEYGYKFKCNVLFKFLIFFCFGNKFIIGYDVVGFNLVECVFLRFNMFFENLIVVSCIFK